MFFEDPALLFGIPLLVIGLGDVGLVLFVMFSYWLKPG